jgi:hypothetical protein
MTSGDATNVVRCRYCGREFDVRRFQVRLVGSRSVYDSTECAHLDAVEEAGRTRRLRRAAPDGAPKRR